MNTLTADFLTNLAAELSGALIPALARRLRDNWQGDASARAIEACFAYRSGGSDDASSKNYPCQKKQANLSA